MVAGYSCLIGIDKIPVFRTRFIIVPHTGISPPFYNGIPVYTE